VRGTGGRTPDGTASHPVVPLPYGVRYPVAVRVVIAEDLTLLREGLAALLGDCGHEVVASVGDGEALLAAVEEHCPDIALVDVRMPPTQTDEGVRAALEARRLRPELAILILSQYVEERYAADLLAGGARGVGYLLKDRIADVDQFLAAIDRVAGGGTVIDPEVIAQLLVRQQRDNPLDRLTPRETEVLALMAEGHTNAAIVERLDISHSAVEKHVRKVFAKLRLNDDDKHHRRVLAVLTYLGA
jgi:DNA-binding NarL/FixJ family response regulator